MNNTEFAGLNENQEINLVMKKPMTKNGTELPPEDKMKMTLGDREFKWKIRNLTKSKRIY